MHSDVLVLMSSFDRVIGVSIFVSYILIDGLYAKYTLEVVALQPIRSATIGSMMHLLLAFGVINYTQNRLYIVPLVLGSWIGTYLIVRREQKKKKLS